MLNETKKEMRAAWSHASKTSSGCSCRKKWAQPRLCPVTTSVRRERVTPVKKISHPDFLAGAVDADCTRKRYDVGYAKFRIGQSPANRKHISLALNNPALGATRKLFRIVDDAQSALE
jgi:hypothetical protein